MLNLSCTDTIQVYKRTSNYTACIFSLGGSIMLLLIKWTERKFFIVKAKLSAYQLTHPPMVRLIFRVIAVWDSNNKADISRHNIPRYKC